MSAIFGETLTFTQAKGEPIRLVVFGDDMFARPDETVDGFTVVYDEDIGQVLLREHHGAAGLASRASPPRKHRRGTWPDTSTQTKEQPQRTGARAPRRDAAGRVVVPRARGAADLWPYMAGSFRGGC